MTTNFGPNALGHWSLGVTFIENPRTLVIHLIAWTLLWTRHE